MAYEMRRIGSELGGSNEKVEREVAETLGVEDASTVVGGKESAYVLPPRRARVSYMSSGSVRRVLLAVVLEHLYRLRRHLPRHLYCARAP